MSAAEAVLSHNLQLDLFGILHTVDLAPLGANFLSSKAILLKGHAGSLEVRLWQPWLSAAARLAERWADFDDDPFSYNETASVSLLSSAAAQVGYLGLAEYVTTKRSISDLRRKVSGRSDYWMSAEYQSWLFEFKQLFPVGVPRKRHREKMERAVECARATRTDGDRKVGGLIVSLQWCSEAKTEQAISAMQDVPKEFEFGWHLRVRGRKCEPHTFVFFSSPNYHRDRR